MKREVCSALIILPWITATEIFLFWQGRPMRRFYVAVMREVAGEECRISVVMQKESREGLSRQDMLSVLEKVAQNVYFTDLTEPIRAYDALTSCQPELTLTDQVIVAEDTFGAETLAVMLVKLFGDIYFPSAENHYGTAQLVAESMGKNRDYACIGPVSERLSGFYPLRIVRGIMPQLEEINRLYGKKKTGRKQTLTKSRARSLSNDNAGRTDGFVYQSRGDCRYG